MAAILNANEIVARALETIGATSTSDRGPQGSHVKRGLEHLSLILDSMAASGPVRWYVPSPATIPLEEDEPDYDLSGEFDDAGVVVVESVALIADGDLSPIELVSEEVFATLDPGAAAGKPSMATMSQAGGQPTLRVWPEPSETAAEDYSLYVTAQRGADVVLPKGGQGINLVRGLGLHLMWRLSYNLGSGPIRRLPQDNLRQFQGDARTEWINIESWIGRAHTEQRGFTANRNF